MLSSGDLTGPSLRLMRDPFPIEMLFDTTADPYEIENLAESDIPAHRQVLDRMRAALDTWIVETGDRGNVLEPLDLVAPFEKEMDVWFGTPDWYRPPKP